MLRLAALWMSQPSPLPCSAGSPVLEQTMVRSGAGGVLLAGAVQDGVLLSRSKSPGLLMSTRGRARQRLCQEDRR
jgi:hypothetical protein